MLVILDGIQRSHDGIFFSFIREDLHLMLGIESLHDFAFRISGFLHGAVTVALMDGTVQNFLYLFFRQLIGIRSSLTSFLLLEETWLQVLGDVFVYSFFGITLHTRIDGRIDFQSVSIYIVVRAVLFRILVAPAVQRICFPGNGIFVILLSLPSPVIALVRLLGCHDATQVFTEVSGQTVFVVYRLELQGQRQCFQRITFGLCQIIGFPHLVEHDVSSSTAALIETARVIERRILTHTYQGSGFLHREVFRVFAEISLGSRLDTNRIVQEIKFIEVHGQNLFLCIVPFQFDCDDPFDRFLQQTLHDVVGCGRIELLGQLLGDGTTSSRVLLHQDSAFDDCPREGPYVNTGMVLEPDILCGYQCLYQIRR